MMNRTQKHTTGKKFLALLLALIMILSLLPTSVLATGSSAEETIYVLAGGDFQEAGDPANSADNVRNILAQVSQKYQTMNGFLFVGDYDCDTHNDEAATKGGIEALMGAVQGKYPNLNDENSVLVQGNHDYKDSRIDATGGHDMDVNGDGTYDYSAYVLNEDDYPNGGGSQAGIQDLANNLKTWLNNKIGEGYDRPVFIVSHLPLAYTPRTVTQGDAKYAKYIFDVLNDAGANGLNIIFLHGHDHAFGPDNYMGGEAIYLPKGDKICIAEAGSTSAWTEETLNFCYMNAGYTGYYSDPYTYNTTAGTDKLTMTVFAITGTEVTVERYSANGLYNLKSAGYNGSYSNTSVTNVSLGLPEYSTVYTSPQTITLATNDVAGEATIGKWIGIAGESTDDVTAQSNGWVEIIAPVAGSTTYAYTQVDSITAGGEYIIVGNDHAIALQGTTNMGTQSVTINGTDMTSNTLLTEWTFSGSAQGTIYNGTRYLCYSDKAFRLSTSSTTFSIKDNGSNFRIQSGNYSFYYNGSSWTRSSKKTPEYVRLFVRNEDGDVTVGGTNGTYGKIAGDLTYNATAGMTAEQAMALVKGGIDGYVYEAMSTPGSDVIGTKVDDSVLTWEWVDTFDGTTAGDYAVKVSYNGKELGTAEVVVPASTTYYAAEGNGLYLVDMNTTEADALAAVKAGVTVYSADNAEGTGKTAISDNDVTWKWVDKYNGADSGPYTVEILKDGTSLGTVEVKVNIKYETGLNGWTYISETEATGGTHTYTLDTDGIDADGQYIIVAESQELALHTNGTEASTAVPVSISSDGKTLTTDTRDYEYYWNSTYGFTRDGYNGLYQADYKIYLGTKADSYMPGVINNGNGTYCLYDNVGTKRTLYYGTRDGDTRFLVSEQSNYTAVSVRLYKYTGTTGGTPAGSVYALIEGNTVYTVTQGSSATKALAAVKAGITGYTATDTDGTGKTEIADSDLTWKWKNTFNGNSTGSYWVEISYQGKVLGTVEVKVEPGVVNNYPEYPDEGSVKVNKTGTGIDFQSSGIAQVELSASGVPIKKGADVIVMLDTSSSMQTHTVTGTNQTRAEVLEESLTNLIAQFKTPGADGQLLDIRVAIADFNGFYGDNHSDSGTAYDRDAADKMSDGISYTADSKAKIYTGDGTLGAGAFIPVEDLAASYTLNYTSGTNYDYAFDAIYQMGTAIKEASGSEDRDLYVIFMSDGAAMQWNYYHSQGASSLWNNWITGAWDAADLTSSNLNCTEHAYYYDEVDHNGDGMKNEHRMANAIKGDPAEQFEVIRKVNTLGTSTGETNMYMVPGLGAKMFSISFDAKADTNVTEESMDKSIASLASEQKYYYKVTTADELTNAFAAIGSEIAYAAYNARFVDQMGDDYNLQMKPATYSVVDGDSTTRKTLAPKIEIISYDIYTRQDYLNGTITENKIGDRKGTYTVLETVTFNKDGTEAYSDKKTGNILIGGVIYAQSFWYNTNANSVAVEGVSIPTGTKSDGTTTGSTNMLPSETFYWKMGTVQTSELAMRYYVYLTGSMEGTREAGSYPTNESATLYYTNWLGNEAKKDTVSPVLAWKSANVSYAFYLVDENGKIIVNKTTGQTGSFANKVAVTNPVVYSEVLLNSAASVQANILASGVLPEGYALYDTEAAYNVRINSNSTGGWTITKGTETATTYVTEYGGDPTTELSTENSGYDYTHTVVWFAVKYQISCVPDAVVIDFGLPVDISVLANDILGEGAAVVGLAAVGSIPAEQGTATPATGFSTDKYNGTYGTATINGTKVRYTPKDMQMNGAEKFAYAAKANLENDQKYYYSTVTVIPAANIYYEDSFVTFDGAWEPVGQAKDGITQQEDRPGQFSLSAYDANNVYGYDAAYTDCTTYSLGSAKKVTVNSETNSNPPTATFTFTGTGFDLISLTSNTTGTIFVEVYPVTNNEVGKILHRWAVDTYYGYTRTEDGYIQYKWTLTNGQWHADKKVISALPEGAQVGGTPQKTGDITYEVNYQWTVTNDSNNALYQIPVIRGQDLEYGTYKVIIKPTYYPAFDNVPESSEYDFYLDAVRIYDPAGKNPTGEIGDAYKADGEGWPNVIELRSQLIKEGTLNIDNDNSGSSKGIVFVDGIHNTGSIDNYTNYGPNNEVYLASGQAIAFKLKVDDTSKIASIQLAAKAPQGTAVAKVNDGTSTEITTATEMYYDITHRVTWSSSAVTTSNTIVVANTGRNILSLTNIKITYKEAPVSAPEAQVDAQVLEEAPIMLLSMRGITAPAEPEPTFAPERFEAAWNRSTVRAGQKATLTVKTSEDVEAVMVDGVTIDTYRTRTQRTGWGQNATKVTYREFTYTITAAETADYAITAVNAEGIASEPITAALTVQAASQRPSFGGWLDKIFSRWF